MIRHWRIMDDFLKSVFHMISTDINHDTDIALIGASLGAYYIPDYRMTQDIDVVCIKISPLDRAVLIDHDLDVVTVAEIPPAEELVINEVYRFNRLHVHIPTIEMFALYKLMTTRGKDYYDLENIGILDLCNIGKIRKLIEEYRHDILSDHPDYNYKRLDELLKSRDLI